jgi:hypothetical protein
MADYRKRLVDMTDEERAEVAPGAPQFSDDYENVGDPLSVQMMEAGLDFTPVGVVRGVSDIKDELSKEDPNYLKALGMAAVEAAGIIPGAAPVAKGMLRKADALTAANKQVSNIEYDARMAQLDEAPDAATWQKNTKKFVKDSRDVNPTVRTPELESSTMDLIDGKITREQHLKNVDQFKPVDPWDALPREPSDKATVFSLKPNQRKEGFFVVSEEAAENLGVVKSALAVGQRFLGRLDIPAYKDYDTWIVAGKSPKGEKGTVYAKAIHYGSADGKPVVFRASQGKSEKIGKGKADPEYTPETHEKTGYATVDGIVQDLDVDSIRVKAAQYLNDPEWTQVGFDPRRQGGFYVRAGENKHVPIREASEVIQIGPLVLARNAKLDFEHTGYAEGGAVMDEQMEMAFGDAGERVDPVSGNEVPIGSMPEEVRDDIPAQLSEGEYVVPADVVRFFGVKLFEDLRMQAKMGFQQMEANGRIGGEPVEGMEVVEPEDDLDIMFDDSDFEVVDGYAEGGVVDSSAALGVLSSSGNQGTTGMETREYVNSTGNIINILFFNGMPMSAIPQGYTYVEPKPDPVSTGGAVTTAADVREDNSDSTMDTSVSKGLNYKELSSSELQAMVEDQKSVTGDAVGIGAAMINPFFGVAVKAAMWHQRQQVEKEITRRMNDETLGASERGQYADLLEISMEDSPGMWTRLFGTEDEKDIKGIGELPFDPISAEPEAVTDALEEAISYTGQDPIPDPEPIEVTSLNDEPGARDYKGPLADSGMVPEPYVSDGGSSFLASEDDLIAEERREEIKKRMTKKQAKRQSKLDSLAAKISAKDSIDRDRSGDDLRDTMERAREAYDRNKDSGLGAQTKKGSTAGSKSGYFD